MSDEKIVIRKPTKNDASHIYTLVKESKALDVNSEYLYLLQSTHFASTCAVATCGDKLIGFVSGYIMPDTVDTLFVWQVAVDAKYRGRDLAKRMITHIISTNTLLVNYIKVTVSPSNKASLRVFEKTANEFNTQIKAEKFFEASDFTNNHEEEVLYKIGPLNKGKK